MVADDINTSFKQPVIAVYGNEATNPL